MGVFVVATLARIAIRLAGQTMSVSSADVLKGFYNLSKAVGDKSINSDAYFDIEGFPGMGILIKQFPWPVLTPGGEIEMSGPMGSGMWQPQQLKVHQQAQVSFTETTTGAVHNFLKALSKKGWKFNAWIYEGSPDAYYRAVKIRDAFVQIDPTDRDWDNRTQVTMFSGTMFYHFFGEDKPGNILPV